jgi:diketogulonate reductase-like aldo/keto reductase
MWICKSAVAIAGRTLTRALHRYLIHSPFFPAADEKEQNQKLQDAWKQMEQLQASGKTRSIGVSNYVQKHLETTLAVATVVPAVNQIEYNPYLQHGKLLDFHKSKGIVTAAYAAVTPVTCAKGGPLDDLLPGLAKKYYVTDSEICLRYVLEKDAIAITTSSKEQRMSDYMRATAFKMTPKEVQDMDKLGAQKHYRGFWSKQYAADDRT